MTTALCNAMQRWRKKVLDHCKVSGQQSVTIGNGICNYRDHGADLYCCHEALGTAGFFKILDWECRHGDRYCEMV